ncbi:MAG TPA: hypothetical protein EYP85_13755 [Armatimonadetes bacterium]|nr:hypothetical protein [Armatimonadota bacterium]
MGERVFDKVRDSDWLKRSPIFVFAADALAAGGIQSLGQVRYPTPHYRTRSEFLQLLREITADGYIDGLLMTPADAEVLALEERLFDHSPVTPIVRMNAETGIWNPRHGVYRQQYSAPFQTVPLTPEQHCENLICVARECYIRLGLYSITLNNDVEADERTLNAYLEFARQVGEIPGFDHILEVFLPNINLPGMDREARGEYAADSIVRTMSYLRKHQRPLFIKTEYTTERIWRELTSFDPTLIIGALGGPRESPRRTLELAYNVTEHGGHVILFGRTVFTEENPRLIARALRQVLDREKTVDEALTEYEAGLEEERAQMRPRRW